MHINVDFFYRKIHSGQNLHDLVVIKASQIPNGTTNCSRSLTTATPIPLDTFNPVGHLPSFIQPPSAQLPASHLAFLHAEGALNLPSFEIQQSLVEAYAEFAYPYMPVVHLQDLLDILYGTSVAEKASISLLLYQAILFSGCAFVDEKQLIKLTGGPCRKSARMEFARRVTVRLTTLPHTFRSLHTVTDAV